MINSEFLISNVASALNLTSSLLNKMPTEQVCKLSEILDLIPAPFDKAVHHVSPEQLADSFVSVGLNGCSGKEIPFGDLCSACKKVGIMIESASPIHKANIIRAISRNPETRIINSTVFYALYKYWYNRVKTTPTIPPNLLPTTNSAIDAHPINNNFEQTFLLVESDEFEQLGCRCILELIFERVFPRGELNLRLPQDLLLDKLWEIAGLKVTPIQMSMLLRVFITANILYNNSNLSKVDSTSNTINVHTLYGFLVYINRRKLRKLTSLASQDTSRRRQSSTSTALTLDVARQDIVQTRVLRALLPFWNDIFKTILAANSSTAAEAADAANTARWNIDRNLCFVNKLTFKSAADHVGCRLGQEDLICFWAYITSKYLQSQQRQDSITGDDDMASSTMTMTTAIPLSVLDEVFESFDRLSLGRQRMKISDIIRDEEPPRLLKPAPATKTTTLTPPPSSSASTSTTLSVAQLLCPPADTSTSSTSSISLHGHANQSSSGHDQIPTITVNSSYLPWQNSEIQTSNLPNGCIRIRERMSKLPLHLRRLFVSAICKSTLVSSPNDRDMRSLVSEALLSVGVRHSHKEVEELISVVATDNKAISDRKSSTRRSNNIFAENVALFLDLPLLDSNISNVSTMYPLGRPQSHANAHAIEHMGLPPPLPPPPLPPNMGSHAPHMGDRFNRRHSAGNLNQHAGSSFGFDNISELLEWDNDSTDIHVNVDADNVLHRNLGDNSNTKASTEAILTADGMHTINMDHREGVSFDDSVERSILSDDSAHKVIPTVAMSASRHHSAMAEQIGFDVNHFSHNQQSQQQQQQHQSQQQQSQQQQQRQHDGTTDLSFNEHESDMNAIKSAIAELIKHRADMAYLFRKLSHPGSRIVDYSSIKCRSFSDALIQPPISLKLTRWQSWKLVCQMANNSIHSDFDTSTILFSDVMRFLESCQDGGLTGMLLTQIISEKLYLSNIVKGDRVRMLAQTPVLRQRIRQQQERRGNTASGWEGHRTADSLTAQDIRNLLSTVDVMLTAPEATFVCKESSTLSLDNGNSFSEEGSTLAKVITYLGNLLTK